MGTPKKKVPERAANFSGVWDPNTLEDLSITSAIGDTPLVPPPSSQRLPHPLSQQLGQYPRDNVIPQKGPQDSVLPIKIVETMVCLKHCLKTYLAGHLVLKINVLFKILKLTVWDMLVPMVFVVLVEALQAPKVGYPNPQKITGSGVGSTLQELNLCILDKASSNQEDSHLEDLEVNPSNHLLALEEAILKDPLKDLQDLGVNLKDHHQDLEVNLKDHPQVLEVALLKDPLKDLLQDLEVNLNNLHHKVHHLKLLNQTQFNQFKRLQPLPQPQ